MLAQKGTRFTTPARLWDYRWELTWDLMRVYKVTPMLAGVKSTPLIGIAEILSYLRIREPSSTEGYIWEGSLAGCMLTLFFFFSLGVQSQAASDFNV